MVIEKLKKGGWLFVKKKKLVKPQKKEKKGVILYGEGNGNCTKACK